MRRPFFAALLGGLLLFTGACKSKTDETAAIRDGVVKHIASMNGLNVDSMTIVITQATVNGDKAQASVDIRAKNGEPGAPAMQLTYDLQKQGAEWVVLKGQATGGMQHPAPGEMPMQRSLPPGHSSTGGSSGQMPANHPDFNSILNTAQPPAQQAPATTQQPPAQKPSSAPSKP